jgi:hypothetical protein
MDKNQMDLAGVLASQMIAEAANLARQMLQEASLQATQMQAMAGKMAVEEVVPSEIIMQVEGTIIVNPTVEQIFWNLLVPNLQERRTGEDWADLFGVKVVDPDGWHRHDLSFYDTKITMFDFIEFCRHSTCRGAVQSPSLLDNPGEPNDNRAA